MLVKFRTTSGSNSKHNHASRFYEFMTEFVTMNYGMLIRGRSKVIVINDIRRTRCWTFYGTVLSRACTFVYMCVILPEATRTYITIIEGNSITWSSRLTSNPKNIQRLNNQVTVIQTCPLSVPQHEARPKNPTSNTLCDRCVTKHRRLSQKHNRAKATSAPSDRDRGRPCMDNHRFSATPFRGRRSAAISASQHAECYSTPPFFSDRTDTGRGARGSKVHAANAGRLFAD